MADEPTRPRGRKVEQPSHADILARQDMAALVMQRIESKLDDLTKTVGFHGHDERGELIGTGIAGDLARLKQRVGRYDGWIKYATGALASITVAAAVIWWLIQNRIDEVLR